MLRLDYISCVLTVVSTLLIGRRYWHGWVLAGINSLVICVLAKNTAQLGLIPANIFCIFLYSYNVWNWRKTESPSVGPNQPLTAGAHQPLSVNQLN
jgi:hypothetical protein